MFLLMIVVIVMLVGIILAVVHRNNKPIFWGIIALILVICIPIFLIISHRHENTLKDEIKRVISERNGQVIKIEKLDISEITPFKDEVNKYNILFKVKYKVNGSEHIAWYRGVNTINDIHNQSPGTYSGYGEEWIFEE